MAGPCGSVVARERDCDTKGSGSRPSLTLGCNFPSVVKMAATVYERDNCSGEDARGKGKLRVSFFAPFVSPRRKSHGWLVSSLARLKRGI